MGVWRELRRGCVRGAALVIFTGGVGGLAACGPDYNAVANRLRETTIKQEGEIAGLKAELAGRDSTLRALRERGGPALQTLSEEQLSRVFTAAKIEVRSTSGAAELAAGKGVGGFRVYVRMYTSDGQLMPAAGTMTVEAFELPAAPAAPRRIGVWTFTAEQMKKQWFSGFGLDQFAFDCPWKEGEGPTLPQVVIKARFEDALTGRVLESELSKLVAVPGA